MVEDIVQISNAGTTRLQDDLHVDLWTMMEARLTKFRDGADGSGSNFPPRVEGEFTPWLSAETEEQSIYKTERKSDYTRRIKEKDDERDALLREVMRTVKTFASLSIFPDRQAAALLMQPVMQKYKVSPVQGYAAESVAVGQWLEEQMGNGELMQAARTLGIDESIATLQRLNDECSQLIADRNDERSQQTTAALREARRVSDGRWRSLVIALNAAAIMDDDVQRYTDLFRSINEDIKYLSQLSRQRRRQNARGQEDSTPGGGSDEGGKDE